MEVQGFCPTAKIYTFIYNFLWQLLFCCPSY